MSLNLNVTISVRTANNFLIYRTADNFIGGIFVQDFIHGILKKRIFNSKGPLFAEDFVIYKNILTKFVAYCKIK